VAVPPTKSSTISPSHVTKRTFFINPDELQNENIGRMHGKLPSAEDQAWIDRVLRKGARSAQTYAPASAEAHVLESRSRPDPSLQEEKPKPAHVGATKRERAILVMKQYPMHCLKTNISCIPPILVGSIPIAIGAGHARLVLDALPPVSADLGILKMLNYAYEPRIAVFGEIFLQLCNLIEVHVMVVTLTSALYDFKVCLSNRTRKVTDCTSTNSSGSAALTRLAPSSTRRCGQPSDATLDRSWQCTCCVILAQRSSEATG
jgi:hypothetical protein